MAKVIAMYRTPADTAAFDRHYFDAHVPIAKRIPGLLGYEVTRGAIGTLQGTSPYHLIATLTFDSLADVRRALASPDGQATAADLARFAGAGVDICFAETQAI